MLPAPTTIAISRPRSRWRAICPATACTRSGSTPYSSVPMRDSPESLIRTRVKRGSANAGTLFADGEAHGAADDHVLAGLGRELGAQLLEGLALVAVGVHMRLVEEDVLLEPLAPPALGDLRPHVLGLVGGLLLVDAQLGLHDLVGNVVRGDVLGLHEGHVGGDLAGELDEVVGAGDEVGLAVDLDEGADAVVVVDVGLDRALGRGLLAALGGGRLALDAEDLDRLVDVAPGLGQGGLAVHHPGARAVAQGLDVGGADRRGAHQAFSSGAGADAGSGAGVGAGVADAAGSSLSSCSEVAADGCGLSPTSCLCSWSSCAAAMVGSPTAGWARRSCDCSAAATCASATWRSGVSVWTSPSSGIALGWACCSALAAAAARTASSSASRRAPSSASRAARSSASRRSRSSRSLRACSSAANHTAWPSAATSPIALVMSPQERIASSLPGTM